MLDQLPWSARRRGWRHSEYASEEAAVCRRHWCEPPTAIPFLARRHELVGRCRELTGRVNQLERQLRRLVAPLAPTLLTLEGCGALTASPTG
jgi:hypothetical protein